MRLWLRSVLHWASTDGGIALGNFSGWRGRLLQVILFIGATLIFGLSYTQSILYEGNQNTKFLHGLAIAGRGLLNEDWLANTIDPLPVFSALVALTARINESLFYVYYFLIFGVYVFSLIGICGEIYNKRRDLFKSILIFTAMLRIHASWFILMTQRQTNIPLQYLHFGMADQYLLGEEFQNSAFGVLLLVSIYFFLKKRYAWAVIWIGIACLIHSAYLFHGALLVAAYLLVIFWDNWKSLRQTDQETGNLWQRFLQSARQPFWLGMGTLALVSPVLLYNWLYLGDTSPQISAQALEIIVRQRIPHHSLPKIWLDRSAYFQFGLMLFGTLLTIRSRLFPVMASMLLGGLALTIVQILTKSNSLALLAPWRVSVLLVPLSTTLVISFLAAFLIDLLRVGRLPYALLVVPLFIWITNTAVDRGIYLQEKNNTGYKVNRTNALIDFISSAKATGDIYMIPPMEAEFDDFRLRTGAPIFINWKSHPYKDIEVLEWYQRVQRAQEFYTSEISRRCDLLSDLLHDYRITHVVIQSKVIRLDCGFTQQTFDNGRYVVYALTNP